MRLRSLFCPVVVACLAVVGAPQGGVVLPAATVAATHRGLVAGDRYVVQRGDTLTAIAARAKVRQADLAGFNGVTNPNLIRVGSTLTIPGRGVTAPPPPTRQSVAGTPVLRLGATGPAVTDLQRRLGTAGQRVAADGAFGPVTASAVAAFQRARRLQPDGVVGPGTWSALGVSSPGPTNPLPKTPDPVPSTSGPWNAYGAASYTTRPGDTWASIAKARGTTTQALADANRRKPGESLAVGTVLAVPGSWLCPVAGAVFINDWGFPRVGHVHEGQDLFAPRGRPVLAPVGGIAERSPNGLGGNAVQLHGDDGVRYYFAHLDAYGATGRVKAGTQIGSVGNSGDAISTVTHLHFEVHPGGGPAVNPFPTLTLGCRRA